MAETAIFGVMNKKINSTKQTFTQSISTNVLLKDNTSVQSPTLLVKQSFSTLRACNYFSWAGYYYWIDQVTSVTNDIVEVVGHRDPMASFKGGITGSTFYTSYANSANWSSDLDDPRLGPEREYKLQSEDYYLSKYLLPASYFDKDGCIMMRVMGTGAVTGCRTLFMSVSEFYNLLIDLNNILPTPPYTWTDWMQSFAEISVMFLGGSWTGNLLDLKWVPFSYSLVSSYGTAANQITIGALPVNCNCIVISAPMKIICDSDNFNIASIFPAICSQMPFLKSRKYMDIDVFTPFGTMSFDPELLKNETLIGVVSFLNICTGDFSVRFTEGAAFSSNVTLGTVGGNLGIDLKGAVASSQGYASQTIVNFAQLAQSAGGGAFGTGFGAQKTVNESTSNYASSVSPGGFNAEDTPQTTNRTSVSSGIGGTFNLGGITPNSVSVGGGLGNATALWLGTDNYTYPACCIITCKLFTANANETAANYQAFCNIYGYPTNKVLSLASITGPVTCVGASVQPAGATSDEISTINSMLNNGFYIE